ncbi:SAM-dependent methyltransferase [Rhizorhabdus wittichii DC-6]|nr:SAM-dependent methyltransferase [Rhizorhabdus wittichii DC-6]
MTDEKLAKAAEFWSNVKPAAPRTHWWQHPEIVRHINRLVCGQALDGQAAGFQQLLKDRMPQGGFRRAVSVGSGVAAKEIALLVDGVVQAFDLFEISEERLRASKRLARRNGVFERIRFHCANAFETPLVEGYDLVHWNSSLHHMFDAHEAVSWSYRNLKPGGCFAMEDFVGPSRFQWTDEELEIATRIRSLLPDRLMRAPNDPSQSLDRTARRPDREMMIQADPSEAADSANILGAIEEVFPNAGIILTGGIVYSLALDGLLANFDDGEDAALMQSLLLLDETLAKLGHTHHAVAIAVKESSRRPSSLASLWKRLRG